LNTVVLAAISLAIVVVGVISLWRPSLAVATTLCVFAFEQWAQSKSAFFGQHPMFLNVGVGLISLTAFAAVVLRGQNPFRNLQPAWWVFLALYLFAGLSCVWALNPNESLFLYVDSLPYYVSIVFLTPLLITRPADIRNTLVDTLVLGAITLVLIAFGTELHRWGRTIELQEVVLKSGKVSTRGTPLAVSSLAGWVVMISILLDFSQMARWLKLLRWLVVPVAIFVILRSGTRGQMLATFPVMLAFIWFSRKVSITRVVGAVTAIAVVLVISAALFSEVAAADARWTLQKMVASFESTRVQLSSELLTAWLNASPIHLMIGLGSSSSWDVLDFYCHVVPLEVLVELGLIGFALLLLFYAFMAKSFLQGYAIARKSPHRSAFVALAAVCTYEMLMTLKQGAFVTSFVPFSLCFMVLRAEASLTAARKAIRRRVRQWRQATALPAARPAA
jgi:hypothetical protein